MNLILSFDTEDYITPEAADAEKWWAQALAERGLPGSCQCVAELLRAHKRRGREDVLEAIGAHEIGYHNEFHSAPPIHPVAVRDMSLEEGVAWVLGHEAAGFAEVVKTFKRVPVTYCPPGCSWTPASLLAFASLGVRIWTGSAAFAPNCWYCGLLTQKYDLAVERYYGADEQEEDRRFREDVENLFKKAEDSGTVVIMSHPHALIASEWWDMPFSRGADPGRDAISPPPLRSGDEVQRLKDRINRWLDWIVSCADVEVIDFSDFYAKRALTESNKESRRDLSVLLAESGLKPGEEGRLPLRKPAASAKLPSNASFSFSYGWRVFPEDFDGKPLFDQARSLLWTCHSND